VEKAFITPFDQQIHPEEALKPVRKYQKHNTEAENKKDTVARDFFLTNLLPNSNPFTKFMTAMKVST
jgi:hypothetical protein